VPHISVLVVDDHSVFADAMQARLSAEADLLPVRVAYSIAQARAALARDHFDVVVLDHMLGDGVGSDLAEHIRDHSAGTRVIMLSAVRSVDPVVDAMQAGVHGWVEKTASMDRLITAIRGVHNGEIWLSPELLGKVLPRLIQRLGKGEPGPLDVLTPREREVLDCMVAGLSRAEIAALLQVSANTVRTHTHNLITKLGVHSSLEAVSLVLRTNA
jgi:DNA-binding NarL/FixJ family response regulator